MEQKNYNGVEIEKSWSFLAFAKEFGQPKLANCVNKDTGEEFKSVAFDNGKDITFCHFGYSTAGMTAKDISREKDHLKVGLNTSGNYTLYRQDNAWEDINID